MIRSILIFFVLLFLGTFIARSQQKPGDYPEATDPRPDTLANWSLVTRGLHGSFASPFVKYPKNSIPSIKPQQTCHLTGWKGERVYGQMVFWSADSIADIELAISDFVSSEGKKMPATIAKTQVVKYVLTDEFGGGCDTRKPGDFTVSLSPDVLDNSSSVTLTPKTSRPVWISIDIPENAGAFRYQSKLIVKTKNQISKEFDISLEVVNKTLPKPADWKFYLDLWQNPYSVARYYRVKLWSKEHWSLLTPLMKMLADAGQKTITVSINKRPWGTQTEDPYESMIGWTKKTDGTWEYDYSIFDQWVNFMMALGIKKQINCYSLVPWGNEFYYFDQKSKNEVKLKAEPGSKPYSELLIPFLTDFRGHLQKKGWNKITCLAMDERAPEEMKAMLSLVSAIAPEFGISLADNHKSYKLYPDQLKDLSVAFGAIIEEKDLTYRKANNMVSTFYLCCTNEFPNNFTFSPPSEGIYIGWYAMAANLDGFLRWSFNNWVANPLTDSRFRTWPAGDTYIVYPGARSSVRFEMLRDGIEDAEKIRILRDQFTTQNRTDELKKLNQLVGQFNQTKKPANTDEMIFNAQSRLNELSKNN